MSSEALTEYEEAKAALVEFGRLPRIVQKKHWPDKIALKRRYLAALRTLTNPTVIPEPETFVTPTRIHLKADNTKYLAPDRVKFSGLNHAEYRS